LRVKKSRLIEKQPMGLKAIYIKDMAWCIRTTLSPLSLLDEFQPLKRNEMLPVAEYIKKKFELKEKLASKNYGDVQ
jgi:hypothetical protein